MAENWIKMRASLATHPKVLEIAALIGASTEASSRLVRGELALLRNVVTDDVTRDITLASLLRVWGAVNDHTEGGVMAHSDLKTVDQIAGIPGFGNALVTVGWVIFDEKTRTLTFPDFLDYNVPSKAASRSPAAERQARYRKNQKLKHGAHAGVTGDANGDGNGNVTRNVTVTPRLDKKRNINIDRKIDMPEGFAISDEVRSWAKRKRFDNLEEHFEAFVDTVKRNGNKYIDWDAAFRTAVRDDWAKLRKDNAPANDKFKGVK